MRPVSHDPKSSTCPLSTVRPDANGWVPPGTCGYLARPYYPSFVAALVFCIIAAVLLVGYTRMTILTRRHQLHNSGSTPRGTLLIPLAGCFLSTCLVAAYVLRAYGTKYQQVPEFVAYSDTLVLMSPILVFAFDSSILIKIMRIISANGTILGVRSQVLQRSLAVTITLLSIEQLIASVIIAPKHRGSVSAHPSNHAMLGVELYLGGIGVQSPLMMYTLVHTIAMRRRIAYRADQGHRVTTVLSTLIFSLIFLLARTIYRLVELSSFSTGYLTFFAHSEVYFYAFECFPVILALGIWLFVKVDKFFLAYLPDDNYTYHELHVGIEDG